MKNSLFDSLFPSESYVFYHQNFSSLKMYHLWLNIVKKQEFRAAPRRCDIHFKPSLNAENLPYMVFGTLACACMHVYAYAYMKHAHAELEHACAFACMHTHALGFSWSLFSKNSLFGQKISYIFHKHFP